MPVGRRPKPTHLKLLEGTFNVTRDRRRKNQPKPTGALIDPPTWFSAEQQEIWRTGLHDAPRGVLTLIDASVYTVWVVACATHRQAAELLAQAGSAGLLTRTATRAGPPGPNGQPTRIGGSIMQSPLVGIMNRQAEIMMKAATEMGFTPSSRSRVTSDPHAPIGSDAEREFFGDAP